MEKDDKFFEEVAKKLTILTEIEPLDKLIYRMEHDKWDVVDLEHDKDYCTQRNQIDYIDLYMMMLNISNYTIRNDYSVDVVGNVNLHNMDLTELPVNFNKVTGNFNCSLNELESLKGCPKEVGGKFDCRFNLISSLEHCPIKVGKSFAACENYFEDLKPLLGAEIKGSLILDGYLQTGPEAAQLIKQPKNKIQWIFRRTLANDKA